MNKWKAFIPNFKKGNKKIELYNLELDPREHTDIAKYHPEIIKEIKKIIKQEHKDPAIKLFQMPFE